MTKLRDPVGLAPGEKKPLEQDAMRTPDELHDGTCGAERRTRSGVYVCGLIAEHKALMHRDSRPGFFHCWKGEEEK